MCTTFCHFGPANKRILIFVFSLDADYHKFLVRGSPQLCSQIKRIQQVVTPKEKKTNIRKSDNPISTTSIQSKQAREQLHEEAPCSQSELPILSTPSNIIPTSHHNNIPHIVPMEEDETSALFEGRKFYSMDDDVVLDCLLTCTFFHHN